MHNTKQVRARSVPALAAAALSVSLLVTEDLCLARGKKGAPARPDPECGSIGLTVKVKGPTAISKSFTADVVFFVRLGEDVDAFGAACGRKGRSPAHHLRLLRCAALPGRNRLIAWVHSRLVSRNREGVNGD